MSDIKVYLIAGAIGGAAFAVWFAYTNYVTNQIEDPTERGLANVATMILIHAFLTMGRSK